MKRVKRSATTLEYVVLIVITVAALTVFSGYLRRTVSGRMREAGDIFGSGRQYGKTIISGAKVYDCRTSYIYTCGGRCTFLHCSYPFYCQPTCYSVEGFGLSDDSMSDACSKAVTDAYSKVTPTGSIPKNICGKKSVTFCGWYTSKITWSQDLTKVVSDIHICPGQP